MKMSDIKLPMMVANTRGAATDASTNISASALYKYLGWSASRRKGTNATQGVYKNGVPLLLYLDIFKNFFANTQEKKFYMIRGGLSILSIGPNIYKIPAEDISVYPTNNTDVGSFDEASNWTNYWKNVKVIGRKNGSEVLTTMADLTTNPITKTITLDKVLNVITQIIRVEFDRNIIKYINANLKQYDLKILDQIRDVILHKKGNETLVLRENNVGEDNNGSPELSKFILELRNSQEGRLGGMLLKTYDSDIFNNWILTDWIDGAGSITEITSIDITANDGKLTMDALNLQQKVYNMLNRIAVSGGTYRDWLETVYTAGKYLDRPETPVFIGGMTQYIEFDEVISKSATETAHGINHSETSRQSEEEASHSITDACTINAKNQVT